MVIYVITNLIDSKRYIGLTEAENPLSRWVNHKSQSKKSTHHLHRAMRKYGFDNFTFEVIDESATTRDELMINEVKWIAHYNTFLGEGYNMTSGGEIGKQLTPERLVDMRARMLGNTLMLGKSHSDESKLKMSQSHIGLKKGIKLTEEHKRKIRQASNKGKTGIQCKNSIRVVQIDMIDGNELCCWFSIKEVGRELGIDDGSISKCCKGKASMCGGFKWRYV